MLSTAGFVWLSLVTWKLPFWPFRGKMSSTDIQDSGEEPCFRLETIPGKSPHLTLPGKASPQVNSRWDQAPQVTANGLHDIEDRILRITGYYGYNPGYSSHKSKCLNTHAIKKCSLCNGVEIKSVHCGGLGRWIYTMWMWRKHMLWVSSCFVHKLCACCINKSDQHMHLVGKTFWVLE